MNDKGVTTGEVQAHLAEISGVQVSMDTISTITAQFFDCLDPGGGDHSPVPGRS